MNLSRPTRHSRMMSRPTRTMAPMLVFLASCGASGGIPPSAVPDEAVATSPTSEELGPGDIVSIRVFREPDLSGKYRIPDSGASDFPLIGDVVMLGKTPQELQDEITRRLGDGYLVNPQVTIFVDERNSRRIFVLGQVEEPGTFAYTPNMTVIEAITLAGGFSQLASRNSVKVSRTVNGKETVLKVAVGSISDGSTANVRLLPGDIVYVPEALF